MAKNPKPKSEEVTATPPETIPVSEPTLPAAAPEPSQPEATQQSEPISFAEPAAQVAEGAVISDEKPADFVEPTVSPKELEALQQEANRENVKRDFFEKIMEARRPKPEPAYEPPPLAPRLAAQTNAELEAGRALVARNEELAAARRPRAPEQEATMQPVFRPADYVPDQKKGQGHVQGRTL